jgi:2-dehydropantoate 2-reductase
MELILYAGKIMPSIKKRRRNMKTLIMGAGVIGTIYGWALAEAGVDVTHYLRPGKKVEDIHVVKLDILDERKGHKPDNLTQYAMHCVDSIKPEDNYELIILPVNANQLEDALKTLVPCSGSAIFLPMTSNWDGAGLLDAYLPRDRYLPGYADGGGTIRDGVYWTNLGAEIHLGEVNGEKSEKLMRVKTLFERADMKPDIQPNILHWLWMHNASAIGFAAGFAKHKAIRPFLKDSEDLKTCIEATRELLSLCEKRGVVLKEYPEISFMSWPTWLVMATMRWLYTTNKSMQRFTAHAASAGSLRETKMNYDAMMKTAEEMQMNTPALKSLGIYLESI